MSCEECMCYRADCLWCQGRQKRETERRAHEIAALNRAQESESKLFTQSDLDAAEKRGAEKMLRVCGRRYVLFFEDSIRKEVWSDYETIADWRAGRSTTK